jgi:hypothetical protein
MKPADGGKFATTVLALGAAVFVGIGAWYTLDPTAVGAIFPDGNGTLDARTEVRAVFGGIELAVGVFFALGVFGASLRAPALLLACLVSFGAGLARVGGMLLEGDTAGLQPLWAALEVAGGAVALAAYVLVRVAEGRRRVGESAG